jgi:photosystem II stability/assembly factor-like uncharacterized protein
MKMRLLPLALLFVFVNTILAQVWEAQAPDMLPPEYYVSDISIVNENIVWAVAFDYSTGTSIPAGHISILLKTTNGGANWDTTYIEGTEGRIIFDIYAFDENTACITTQDFQSPAGRGVFRTTDGGENWTQVQSGDEGGVWIHFFDDQEGVCINANSSSPIAYTSNGGIDWTEGDIPALNFTEGSTMSSSGTALEAVGDHLWFGTDQGRILKSTDRGQTWDAYPMNLGGNYIYSVAFVDEMNGIAMHSTGYQLAKTSDGGATWSAVTYPYEFYEVTAIPCSGVFMGVNWEEGKEITAISTDLGETWQELDIEISAWAPNFKSPTLGWMAEGANTSNAALYKWIGETQTGRIYVNQNAVGSNDGSSWFDAYTDLQVALDSAEAGDEIWVAEGTYLPGDDPASTFLIDKNLKLYGGFAGTECYLSERNIEAYLTILSGDLNGDDVNDDFVNFKSDNTHTVVRITSSVTDATLLDGFIIRGGHANGVGQTSENGGGIYSDGTPTIRNCTFEQNYALVWGGAVAQFDYSGSTVIFDNCHFNNNNSGESGLAIVIIESLFDIRFCTFTGNIDYVDSPIGTTLFIADPYGGTVRNCTFENNQSAFAPGLLVWRRQDNDPGNVLVEILDCEFNNNTATGPNDDIAVANMHLVTNGMNSDFVVKRCTFSGNNGSFAGAISLNYNPISTNSSMLIDSCEFTLNTSQGIGGTIYSRLAGDNLNLEIRNSHFLQNTVADSFGYGTVSLRGGLGNGIAVVDNCVFEENDGKRGGAIWLRGGGNFTDFQVKNSVFRSNEAISGGAVELACSSTNIQTNVTIEYCAFTDNTSTTVGGALNLTEGCNIVSRISGCTFTGNESPKGGAIHAQHQDGSGSTAFLENSLIANNSSDTAAIFADSYDLTLLNNTIANNNSNGIEIANQSSFSIQNTILFNPGYIEFEELTNDVTVTSVGINLFGDDSFAANAIPSDLQISDPKFAALGDVCDNYQLMENSPAINAGTVPNDPSDLDLCGNERIHGGQIDIGALESLFTNSTEVVVIGELEISPNPATDFLYVQLPEEFTRPVEVSLFDTQGKLVRREMTYSNQPIDAKNLVGGLYLIKVSVGEESFTGRFVKQ